MDMAQLNKIKSKNLGKTIFSFAICYLVSINVFSANISKYKIALFLFKDKHTVCIYSSPNRDSVVAKINDNGKAGKLNGFDVLEKQDSMIKVIAWNTVNEKKIKGWIKITETAINGRERNHIYELYNKPGYDSPKTVVNSDWEMYVIRDGKYMKVTANIDANFKVLDISGKWLKVKIKGKNKIYIKWLPREYQCQDISGECT